MKFGSSLFLSLLALTQATPISDKKHTTVECGGSHSTTSSAPSSTPTPADYIDFTSTKFTIFKPKVVIISMFGPEQNVWIEPLNLYNNLTLPGLSPVYPEAHCNADYSICQVTTGEAECNAGPTIAALAYNPLFDFIQTYFLIGGIAGVNPYYGTLGTAGFARFAVQVGLEYEIDAREMPSNWTTGYFAFGTTEPNQYPTTWYGSEVYELNVNLRDRALSLVKTPLNDSTDAMAFRQLYNFAPANQPPKAQACDTVRPMFTSLVMI